MADTRLASEVEVLPLSRFVRRNKTQAVHDAIWTPYRSFFNWMAIFLICLLVASFFFPDVMILKWVASSISWVADAIGIANKTMTILASLGALLVSPSLKDFFATVCYKLWHCISNRFDLSLLAREGNVHVTSTPKLTTTSHRQMQSSVREAKESKQIIDIAFVINASSSMSPYIDAAKTKITQIIDNIVKSNPEANVKIAIVGFRDYHDSSESRDFTTPEKAKLFLQALNAESFNDNDTAISTELGLAIATNLNWRKPEKRIRRVRTVFVITDAPPHAAGCISDHYPSRYSNPINRHYTVEADGCWVGATIHTITYGTNPVTIRAQQEIASVGRGYFFAEEKSADDVVAGFADKVQQEHTFESDRGALVRHYQSKDPATAEKNAVEHIDSIQARYYGGSL